MNLSARAHIATALATKATVAQNGARPNSHPIDVARNNNNRERYIADRRTSEFGAGAVPAAGKCHTLGNGIQDNCDVPTRPFLWGAERPARFSGDFLWCTFPPGRFQPIIAPRSLTIYLLDTVLRPEQITTQEPCYANTHKIGAPAKMGMRGQSLRIEPAMVDFLFDAVELEHFALLHLVGEGRHAVADLLFRLQHRVAGTPEAKLQRLAADSATG